VRPDSQTFVTFWHLLALICSIERHYPSAVTLTLTMINWHLCELHAQKMIDVCWKDYILDTPEFSLHSAP
jgi:hypothetical protein